LKATPTAKPLDPARSLRWELPTLGLAIILIAMLIRSYWIDATAPFVAMTYRETQIELVSDAHNLCGPGRTAPTGEMSVPVDYFDVSTSGRVFQVTQFRHEICSAEGCPIRVFILNPDGSRGLLVNGVMLLIEQGKRGAKAQYLLISRDGRTLKNSSVTYALNWS
jgi:hypothetical protein